MLRLVCQIGLPFVIKRLVFAPKTALICITSAICGCSTVVVEFVTVDPAVLEATLQPQDEGLPPLTQPVFAEPSAPIAQRETASQNPTKDPAPTPPTEETAPESAPAQTSEPDTPEASEPVAKAPKEPETTSTTEQPEKTDQPPEVPSEPVATQPAEPVEATAPAPKEPPPQIRAQPTAASRMADLKLNIGRKIRFQKRQPKLHPASQRILKRVVQVLQEHPELKVVEIQGHAARRRSARQSMRLSKLHAAAVWSYLVRQGVMPSRLRVRGFGHRTPLLKRRTKHARNNRIELVVLERAQVTTAQRSM